ncbi:restriction endonuclease subunit S [Leptospira bandrabouensis]|uniref:restriction endonuclease subunit S n=1 Tax=Leptospira bandrabouensis TaxID=2484903 RepID=UPI001EECDCC6|nr:restriction endonuclease subunit S [Leptospira bandrabouensis]MCG6146133.1 restriction endonuclease subunit S [Leptospira bandrabouensis]MCG6165720.1 restriction endonuclease subunit S [Leptospira bandrabouensis]
MSEWKECKLGDAPLEIIDGDRGKNYPSQDEFFSSEHTLFLSTKNVRKTGFDFQECQFITKDKDEKLRKGKLSRNDLVVTTRGTVGNLAFYNKNIPFENIRINSGMVLVRPEPNKLNPLFNYYIFRFLQSDFETFSTGSAQPQLPIRDMKEIPILLPPLAEQKAIAGVLSALDDKIDLLHRQNKTLEAMAEALFRQWFVRGPELAEGEEAEESLEEGKLGDLVTIVSGTTPKTENPEFWNGEYHWTSPRDITNLNGLFLFDTERKITKLGLDQIGSGLLPAGSLLMSSRAPVGALAFAEIPVAINQGYAGIICDKGYKREFIYLWLKANMDMVHSYANGSTFQEISKSAFKSLDISIPDPKKMATFHSIIDNKFEKIRLNSIQIRSLEKLRDTLLPKLMSGEVRVEV